MIKLKPYFVSAAFTIFNLFIHFFSKVDTMINIKGSYEIAYDRIKVIVDTHRTYPPFAKRPFTTILIDLFSRLTNLNLGVSFIFVNYFLMFISGILVFKLSELIVKSKTIAMINLIAYSLCFSTIFVFYPPVYTYDEPLQYCLLFAAFIFFWKKRWIFFVTAFSFSAVVRESSLILIPGFLYLLFQDQFHFKQIFSRLYFRKFLILLVPCFIFIFFTCLYVKYLNITDLAANDVETRFMYLQLNFENAQFSTESITSLYLIVGLPLYFLVCTLLFKPISKLNKQFIKAFILTIIINSLIVFFCTKAREVRLFVIPMFFIWPIFGEIFKPEIKMLCSLKSWKGIAKKWDLLLFYFFLNFLNYMISFYIYKMTVGNMANNYFNEYLFFMNLIIITHLFMKVQETSGKYWNKIHNPTVSEPVRF